jgi:hypothetical protein
MVKKIHNNTTAWYNQKIWLASTGIISLGLAYLLLSRAIDTGSWWEYLGTLVLLVFAINRLLNSIKFRSKDEQIS